MSEHIPDEGLPLLEWYKGFYIDCSKCYEELKTFFPFFNYYKNEIFFLTNKGIKNCEDEIINYSKSFSTISYTFYKDTVILIEQIEQVMNKITLHEKIFLKSLDSFDFFGFSQN
ncbi:hypothetical protein COU58_02150 [Candidatus Pacearchaeota archaeon CG10_big_fil_rev_8_21_14_0_10_32_42]|nr:MAG: hypothetical protein COU58_02150 [Candidatus Pacearchaeota archaeon CG10_big_fil_rev_8_21_14_0_10_32_42]